MTLGTSRVLALDLGARRIGVAVSDRDGVLATPSEVVLRSGDLAKDHARIAELVADTEAGTVVVGLPYSLDGSIGPAAAGVLDEVEALAQALDVPVVTYDERLTTVTAERSLREAGVRGKKRRSVIDAAAAAVLLQSWLDHKRASQEP